MNPLNTIEKVKNHLLNQLTVYNSNTEPLFQPLPVLRDLGVKGPLKLPRGFEEGNELVTPNKLQQIVTAFAAEHPNYDHIRDYFNMAFMQARRELKQERQEKFTQQLIERITSSPSLPLSYVSNNNNNIAPPPLAIEDGSEHNRMQKKKKKPFSNALKVATNVNNRLNNSYQIFSQNAEVRKVFSDFVLFVGKGFHEDPDIMTDLVWFDTSQLGSKRKRYKSDEDTSFEHPITREHSITSPLLFLAGTFPDLDDHDEISKQELTGFLINPKALGFILFNAKDHFNNKKLPFNKYRRSGSGVTHIADLLANCGGVHVANRFYAEMGDLTLKKCNLNSQPHLVYFPHAAWMRLLQGLLTFYQENESAYGLHLRLLQKLLLPQSSDSEDVPFPDLQTLKHRLHCVVPYSKERLKALRRKYKENGTTRYPEDFSESDDSEEEEDDSELEEKQREFDAMCEGKYEKEEEEEEEEEGSSEEITADDFENHPTACKMPKVVTPPPVVAVVDHILSGERLRPLDPKNISDRLVFEMYVKNFLLHKTGITAEEFEKPQKPQSPEEFALTDTICFFREDLDSENSHLQTWVTEHAIQVELNEEGVVERLVFGNYDTDKEQHFQEELFEQFQVTLEEAKNTNKK